MKTFRFLATLLIVVLCVTSCSSDDDDNIPNPDAPKKRITQIVSKQYGDTETAKFEYSGEKVSKITVTRTGESKPWTTEFEYSSNEIKVHYTNLWFEGEGTNTRTFSIGLNGFITNYELEFKYDNDGNVISNDEFDSVTYTKTLNISNLYLAFSEWANITSSPLWAGIVCKASKHLPKEAKMNVDDEGLYTYSYDYDLDKDGYVTTTNCKLTVNGKHDKADDWTETYTYEIIQ